MWLPFATCQSPLHSFFYLALFGAWKPNLYLGHLCLPRSSCPSQSQSGASRCSPSSFTSSSINERPIPTEQPLIVSFRSSWPPFDVFVTGNTQLCPILVRCGTDAT